MNERNTLIAAAVLSVVAHLMFLASSPHIRLGGMRGYERRAHELFRMTAPDRDLVQTRPEKKRPAVPEAPDSPDPVLQETQRTDLFEPSASMPLDPLPSEPERAEVFDRSISDIERELIRETLDPEKYDTATGPVSAALVPAVDAAPPQVITAREATRRHPSGDTEPGEGLRRGVRVASDEEALGISEHFFTALSGVQDISELIELELNVYDDRASGHAFFEAAFRLKRPDALKVRPKELVFLIDTSRSILPRHLGYVIRAVEDAVGSLKRDDRFNILAFREEPIRFRERSVPPTRDNMRDAFSFLSGLESAGATDVESALLEIVTAAPELDPAYVIMITDGRPTAGVQKLYRLLQHIRHSNVHDKAIYCIGAGLRIDEELLALVALQNRGRIEIPDRNHMIGEHLKAVLSDISDPVLTAPSYFVAGAEREEIFPRQLTDLFRTGEVKVYGRVPHGTSDLVLEIYGRTFDTEKKFSFSRDLTAGDVAGRDIARSWALHKLYDILSRMAVEPVPSPQLLDKARNLSDTYKVDLPYAISEIAGGE